MRTSSLYSHEEKSVQDSTGIDCPGKVPLGLKFYNICGRPMYHTSIETNEGGKVHDVDSDQPIGTVRSN